MSGYWSESRMQRRVERRQNFGKFLKGAAGMAIPLIKGWGDYEIKSNSLISGSAGDVPQFDNVSGMRSVRIQHREFIGDVSSSTGFQNTVYAINPANQNLFPWLSQIANKFQEYKMWGMVVTYNSLSSDALNSTNTALGAVIMSTDYNAGNTPFSSKSQAENSEYTVSCKPSESLQHGIECDPGQVVNAGHLYVSPFSNGLVPTGQDIKTYNMGNFQFMTQGSQAAATIGELWVSYDVELMKPTQLNTQPPFAHYYITSGVANATPFGTLPKTARYDSLGLTFPNLPAIGNSIQFPASATNGDLYKLTIWWIGSTGATSIGATTPLNCAVQSFWQNGGASNISNAGAVGTILFTIFVVRISSTATPQNPAVLTFTGLTLPVSPSCELTVEQLPDSWQ